MNLSAMTLDDLAQFQVALELLGKAGAILERLPRDAASDGIMIDLTPGGGVVIMTGFRMPMAYPAETVEFPLVETMGGGHCDARR